MVKMSCFVLIPKMGQTRTRMLMKLRSRPELCPDLDTCLTFTYTDARTENGAFPF